MFELSVDDIRMDESQGAVGGLTADCAYPFYYDGEEGETKFGTEEVELKNASNDMTSYMLLGTCRDPEDVEVYGRKYEFYIYSITFNPISSGTKKYVFEKKRKQKRHHHRRFSRQRHLVYHSCFKFQKTITKQE